MTAINPSIVVQFHVTKNTRQASFPFPLRAARSSGRLLLQRTNAPYHLPRFHENSSSIVSSLSGITGCRSLTPWISAPPADEDGEGNNVTSRRVAFRCVVLSRSRTMTTHERKVFSLLLSSVLFRNATISRTTPYLSARASLALYVVYTPGNPITAAVECERVSSSVYSR